MHQRYDEACDALDASVFSGELVCVPGNRKGFKEYLERWSRAVAEHERLEAEESGSAPLTIATDLGYDPNPWI